MSAPECIELSQTVPEGGDVLAGEVELSLDLLSALSLYQGPRAAFRQLVELRLQLYNIL